MKKDYTHIIISRLRGTISPKEQEELDLWLHASLDNRKIYDDLAGLWRHTGNKHSIEFDSQAEWNKFMEIRDSEPAVTEKLSIGSRRSILFKVAAVLLPLIVLSGVYLFYNQQHSNNSWIAVNSGKDRKHLILPDKSEIWMNQNSEIRYMKQFLKNREIQISGEAFFQVTKNGSIFRVHSGNAVVQVVGTRFNVKNIRDTITQVSVDEGKVILRADKNKIKPVMLEAGEKGIYTNGAVHIVKEAMTGKNEASWATRKLVFSNTPLTIVARDLEQYFSVEIQMSDALGSCMFSGEFEDPRLQNILHVLSIATGSEVISRDSVILIRGTSCMN